MTNRLRATGLAILLFAAACGGGADVGEGEEGSSGDTKISASDAADALCAFSAEYCDDENLSVIRTRSFEGLGTLEATIVFDSPSEYANK